MDVSEKNTQRTAFKLKRSALSKAEVQEKSRAIVQRVLNSPEWKNSGVILLYSATPYEVQTRALIEEGLKTGKQICLPVSQIDGRQLIPYEIQTLRDLQEGVHKGILEPQPYPERRMDPANIQIGYFPGIAFDSKGNRLGSGLGYYDRFLSDFPRIFKIALCFDLQLSFEDLPTEPHDVPMQCLVTESQVRYLKGA